MLEAESECNKISDNVLKCLIGIFLRLSKLKAKTMDVEAFSNLMSLDLSGGDRGPAFGDLMAIITVGGNLLNAATIQHFILRLPYHSCGQPNGARAPSPANNPLIGSLPKAGGFLPLGTHGVCLLSTSRYG
ncbi:hypothetical protein L6452_15296 [Arctium lappa]|uniref:Uncharacterized protein n=1 Tax=Arctium lappa TaxID=4217 RepID=A0ACB9CNL5_ARCLA|nr:hypothetical protein L6452_15296 [Arctium lappa]